MSVIQGSTVLITGGASGIGRRLAELLARRGARLVLWDIHEPSLRATVEDLRAHHGADVRGYVCDVTDRDAVYSMSARVRAEVGTVDILINNAGVVSGKPFTELPDDMIERTFRVNAHGAVLDLQGVPPRHDRAGPRAPRHRRLGGRPGGRAAARRLLAPASGPRWGSTRRCAWSCGAPHPA